MGMSAFTVKFLGNGVGARARRSAIWSFVDFGGVQGLRLISNLILTRLLFPEAFGLMALVMVVITGLALFSDTGIGPSIIQSERGDDPDFLNTAWTVQVVRGIILWLTLLGISAPIGNLYNEPALAQILPIAGLNLLIDGFKPTAIYTANRNLEIGHLTRINLCAQIVGLLNLAALAWYLQSVWALVIGNVLGSLITISIYFIFLPGATNKFRLELGAAKQLFNFGKWIFLGTAAGFLINQGDRAILGLFVSLETLGIYNIGYFLASVPVMLSFALQGTVMTPLYRLKPPAINAENQAEIFRARRLICLVLLTISAGLAFMGPPLVEVLYDPRYSDAGAMITLFSLSAVPMVTLNTIGAAVIGAGDSRAMFFIVGVTALLQTSLLIAGIYAYGVVGALLSPGLAVILSYPIRLIYSRKYHVYDPVQDFGITFVGLFLPIVACIAHYDKIMIFFP